jgi:hypothetical protein
MTLLRTGAALLASATAATAFALGPAPALASAPQVHHMRFVAVQSSQHKVSQYGFVAVEKDRRRGVLVGYDTLSGRFDPDTQTVRVHVAVARFGGLLFVSGRVTQDGAFTGNVTGGTNFFQGMSGTANGHTLDNTRTTVRLAFSPLPGPLGLTARWRSSRTTRNSPRLYAPRSTRDIGPSASRPSAVTARSSGSTHSALVQSLQVTPVVLVCQPVEQGLTWPSRDGAGWCMSAQAKVGAAASEAS